MAHDFYKNTGLKLFVGLFILHSVYGISRCPHADRSLPKFPAPHKRTSSQSFGCPSSLYSITYRRSSAERGPVSSKEKEMIAARNISIAICPYVIKNNNLIIYWMLD